MADAFIGEIRLLPYSFAPYGWLLCNGQQLQINQFQALFAVIGLNFGGNINQGVFNIPNLLGRVAVGAGNNPTDSFDPPFASNGGTSAVTLNNTTVPPHTHVMNGVDLAQAQRTTTPTNNLLTGISFVPTGQSAKPALPYVVPPAGTQPVQLAPTTLAAVGGGTPHENRQPALVLQWCIATQGDFPIRP